MFCNQCEQTMEGGCDKKIGVCGKNEDISSLQDITIFGLKGVAAYAHHARELGKSDPEIDAITQAALYSTLTNVNFSLADNIKTALSVGTATVKAMALLDEAHTSRLGIPEPVTVSEDRVQGKSILVTGHNLYALEDLLKQTEGKGINIYTHSEMLPAHGYPKLKKFSHLKGNVGKAWHDQRRVFDDFPGAILVTTNCVMPVRGTYGDRMFTYDVTGVENSLKIENNDFSPLIKKALSLPDADVKSDKTLTTGFHHENVLKLAPQIIEAVKAGKIKRFFVIAGCDSPGDGSDYFRELAELVPKDCVILTTSCGKFRFNDIDFGNIDGIPRYIDLGQCNNSISAVKIALALADAFKCSVNELPLTIALSWFEQKAVAILLGLFSLGVKNIYLGPKPPEFVTPGVLKVLQDNFNLKLTGDAKVDIKNMLG
ncbi:MAG: hydroxylamine reductase [Thermodesulfovibrionia bacterium]|nr:hydroxylamine reductase [Thermodesulfovibrionia bacterium]